MAEGKEYFYLLLSNSQAYAVPKDTEGLIQFLRKFTSPEEKSSAGETAVFYLGIAFCVFLTAFAVIYCQRPERDILRNWIHYLLYGSMVLAALIMLLRCCLWNLYSIPRIKKTGRRIAARIMSVVLCIIILLIAGGLSLIYFLETGTVTRNADGTYIYADTSYTTRYYLFEADGPFYLRYVRPVRPIEESGGADSSSVQTEKGSEEVTAQQQAEVTPQDTEVESDTGYQQIDDGYRKLYDTYLAESSDGTFAKQYNAKGNSYVIIAQDSSMMRYLMYDRDSTNGKCGLYVLYEVKKDGDGNYSLSDASILDMYAYEYRTGNTADSGRTGWADAGSEEYRSLTGE